MSTEYPIRKDMMELLEQVQTEYYRQVNLVDYFRKKCEEFWKDDEIQKLKKRIDELRRHSLLVLSKKEYTDAAAFREAHNMSCRNRSTFQYELTHAGIGTIISIRCPVCGKTEDITDTSIWWIWRAW